MAPLSFPGMPLSLPAKTIASCAGLLVLAAAWAYWSWSSAARISAECRGVYENNPSPAAGEIYAECMRSEGLDPGRRR